MLLGEPQALKEQGDAVPGPHPPAAQTLPNQNRLEGALVTSLGPPALKPIGIKLYTFHRYICKDINHNQNSRNG